MSFSVAAVNWLALAAPEGDPGFIDSHADDPVYEDLDAAAAELIRVDDADRWRTRGVHRTHRRGGQRHLTRSHDAFGRRTRLIRTPCRGRLALGTLGVSQPVMRLVS
jgi:hypothetical protein